MFKHYVANNLVENVGITIDDISNAQQIYGEQKQLLQGKTTRSKSTRLDGRKIHVPAPILSRHKQVQIAVNNIFVNRIPLSINKSRNINNRTLENLSSQKKENNIKEKLSNFRLVIHFSSCCYQPFYSTTFCIFHP